MKIRQVSCPGGTIYRVRAGDSLYIIAQRFGVSLNDLIAANPQISDPNLVYPGQEICIPAAEPQPPLQGECALILAATDIAPGTRGVALLNFDTNNVLIAAAGLPSTIYEFFVGWLITENISARIELNPTNGVWAGQAANINVGQFAEVIITAEEQPVPQGPLGPIVARASLSQCR